MSTFEFKAIDKKGGVVSDTIQSTSKKEAETFLADQKLKVIFLKEVKEKKDVFEFFNKGNFSLREKISLCRYLSLMINAGIPLGESFELLISETKNLTVKKVIQDISLSVNQGQSLLTCFSKYPQYFDDIFLAMIKTGETSGTLNKSFDYLVRQFKQEDFLKQKVVSALIYPLVIITLMGGIGILMLTFVLPRLARSFLKLDIELPLTTKILLETSLFFEKNILLLFALIFILIFGLFLFYRSKSGKRLFKKLAIVTPVAKNIFLEYNLARFTQSLSALLQAGVPITDSLEISSKSLILSKKGELAESFKDKISQGQSLSTVFSQEKFFPPLMNQMIAIGERTGNLNKILIDLSLFYQDEVENSLKNLVALLEPVLMIIIGLGVGIMVLSVISPIYSLIGKIQPN